MKRINPYKLFVGSFIPNWLLERTDISSGAKLVYARLGQHAGENGYAFPSIETLAKEIGQPVRNVERYLKELKDSKLIETEKRGLGQTNLYFFLAHQWMQSKVSFLNSHRRPATSGGSDPPPVADQDPPPVADIRESVEENHRRESDKRRPSAAFSRELNPKIKEWADKVYSVDKVKFRRLVVWIRAAERTYEPEVIAATLKAFEPLAAGVTNDWWAYLDRILDKVEGKVNAASSQADHENRKEAEADFARSTFGGRALQKDPRPNRHKP